MANPFMSSAAPAAAGSAAEGCARPLSTSAAAVHSNSVEEVMLSAGSAGVIEPASPVMPAALNWQAYLEDGVESPAPVPINVIGHNPVTHAVEVRPQIQSSDGEVQESSASIPDYNGVKSPALVTAHGLSGKSCPLSQSEIGPSDSIDCIGEIFVGARRLQPRELPPDFHARLLAAIESDEIWADEAPLFLRDQS